MTSKTSSIILGNSTNQIKLIKVKDSSKYSDYIKLI
jgi:hypothetical protein